RRTPRWRRRGRHTRGRLDVSLAGRQRRSQEQNSHDDQNDGPRISEIKATPMHLVQQKQYPDRYDNRRTGQTSDRAALAATPDPVAHGTPPFNSARRRASATPLLPPPSA